MTWTIYLKRQDMPWEREWDDIEEVEADTALSALGKCGAPSAQVVAVVRSDLVKEIVI